jgi:putative transposase
MEQKKAYRKTSHSTYLCDYHIVFPTKYRRPCITDELWKYLYSKLLEITTYYPELYFYEANHDKDHIHILISVPPTKKICDIVRLIKSNTSRGIKEKFPILKKQYWGQDGIWSDGYFVSTVGVNKDIVTKYIEKQGEFDTGQTALLFD